LGFIGADEGRTEMIPTEKIIKRLKSQIAVCKEIDSDWISITVGTAKRILELISGNEKKVKVDLEGGWPHWWFVCDECHIQIGSCDRYCRQCGGLLDWEGVRMNETTRDHAEGDAGGLPDARSGHHDDVHKGAGGD
jgi:hypothetical protein